MAKLYNLARVSTSTTGTGTVTLGAAISGFLSFFNAGVSNGETVAYGISDGANSEVGTGVYSSSGPTLTRSVTVSTNSNSAINLSGSAQVYILARAEDIATPPSSSTDNAATRFDGTSGRDLQSSALIIDDTTGRISRSGNGGIPVQGTSTNDSASSGDVGELVESEVLTGASVSISTGTPTNITSISLTAGDWDVWGYVAFDFAASTTSTALRAWISTTSASLPAAPNKGADILLQLTFGAGLDQGLPVGSRRVSVNATTTVYLSAYSDFSVSTMRGFGYIGARRRR